jgi:hypothetical protein
MKTITAFFQRALEIWYFPRQTWLNRWLEKLWIPGLYLIGLIQWSIFLQWGKIPFDMGDWQDVTAPRIFVLQDAVRRGLIPLHIPISNGMKGITDRFLAIPDIILSPQILLLKVLDPGVFLLVDLLLLYSLGFIGLNQIRRKYNLSLSVFSVLFLLFNFNGHIVDHIFIGHATWMSYFLFPFFVLLVFELLEVGPGWGWVLKTALLLLAILLQGGIHQYVQLLLFLGMLGLFTPRFLKASWAAAVFAILIGLFRILPVSLVAPSLNLDFLGGFTTFNDLLRGLVTLIEPAKVAENISRLNPYVAWWEFDFYIGWIGLIFVAGIPCFGYYKKISQLGLYQAILPPVLVLAILSIGRLYKFVFLLHIPMLDGERVGSRFLVLPFLFALVISTLVAQRLLDRYPIRLPAQIFLLGAFLVLFNDLQQHLESWGINRLEVISDVLHVDPAVWVVANHADPIYQMMLIAGAVASLVGLAGLVWLGANSRKMNAWLLPKGDPVEMQELAEK